LILLILLSSACWRMFSPVSRANRQFPDSDVQSALCADSVEPEGSTLHEFKTLPAIRLHRYARVASAEKIVFNPRIPA